MPQSVIGVSANPVVAGAAVDILAATVACLNSVVPRARVVGVAAGSTGDLVGSCTSGEAIPTAVSSQPVAAIVTNQAVVTSSPPHPVRAAEPDDQVAVRAAVQVVGASRAAEFDGAAVWSQRVIGPVARRAASRATSSPAAASVPAG